MILSPETKAICRAAEAVSQTPESFMLNAALAEARTILQNLISDLHQQGDTISARSVAKILADIQIEPTTKSAIKK